ncbi:hypothetical protein ACT7DE_15395 [Bacillus paranthracis]
MYHSHSWESYLPLLNLTNDPNPNKSHKFRNEYFNSRRPIS